jgi:hypothetical protein
MKILLTADLHFHTDWFRWLIEQAQGYDLVCLAGDLLDMFNVEPTKDQARQKQANGESVAQRSGRSQRGFWVVRITTLLSDSATPELLQLLNSFCYRRSRDLGISFNTSCHSLGGQSDISLESTSP